MKRKPPCTVGWCTVDHADDNERIAHHRATIDAQTIDSTTLCVVALWAERLDGRAGVLPHIAVIAPGSPDPLRVDLTPREASTWSALLTVTRSRPWLAEALATGAEMLAAHDDHEHDGQPHRVALVEATEANEADEEAGR